MTSYSPSQLKRKLEVRGLRPSQFTGSKNRMEVPEHVLVERDRRLAAAAMMSPGDALMGVPPPGFGAGDRR